jgi:hypothetical protein
MFNVFMIPTVAEDDAHSAKINESHARPALAVCARIVPTMEDAADGITFPTGAWGRILKGTNRRVQLLD